MKLLIFICAVAAIQAAKLEGFASSGSPRSANQLYTAPSPQTFTGNSNSFAPAPNGFSGQSVPALQNQEHSVSSAQIISDAPSQSYSQPSNQLGSGASGSNSLIIEAVPSQSYTIPATNPSASFDQSAVSGISTQSFSQQSGSPFQGQSFQAAQPSQTYSGPSAVAPSGPSFESSNEVTVPFSQVQSAQPIQTYSTPSTQSSGLNGQALNQFQSQSPLPARPNQVYSGPSIQPVQPSQTYSGPTTPIQPAQPSQAYSRPSAQPSQPPQTYSGPAEPTQPTQVYSGPAQSAQPAQIYTGPSTLPVQPSQTYSGPSVQPSQPSQTYSGPVTQPQQPTQSYSSPSVQPAQPTQSFSRPSQFSSGVSNQPLNGFSAATQPSQIYSRPSVQPSSGPSFQTQSAQPSQQYSGPNGQSAIGASQSFTQSIDSEFVRSGQSSGSVNPSSAGTFRQPRLESNVESSEYEAPSGRCQDGQVLHIDGSCVVPEVTRNVFVYAAPEQDDTSYGPPPEIPLPKEEHNIVFIRTPEGGANQDPIIVPPPQKKHVIYVLSKESQQEQKVIELPAPAQKTPEVYFVNYAEGENPTLPDGIDFETALNSAIEASGQVIGAGDQSGVRSQILDGSFESNSGFRSQQGAVLGNEGLGSFRNAGSDNLGLSGAGDQLGVRSQILDGSFDSNRGFTGQQGAVFGTDLGSFEIVESDSFGPSTGVDFAVSVNNNALGLGANGFNPNSLRTSTSNVGTGLRLLVDSHESFDSDETFDGRNSFQLRDDSLETFRDDNALFFNGNGNGRNIQSTANVGVPLQSIKFS